ncbi:hypothetical protein PENTCL1PPCAC_183 [Pristionchus entomophagus]|uniref:ShKT domain-containing protein n=1 Tax=Pristionchus entomophagus TaxID=358040 RepID=A0AAV5S862_9BILA|nr:hypothetical protein PENTCL1PPCAC_183 [Pristionchus entomophagus]
MTSLLTTVSLLALVSGIAAQCTGNDHPSCASWKNNGYCTNAGAPMEQRKQYCGVTCGFCNTDGTQTAAGGGSLYPACTDANENCPAWNTNNNFCRDTATPNTLKLLHCCGTCRPIIQG